MAVGTVYRVVLTSTLFGQVCTNVFHYGQLAGLTAGAPDLLGGFQTNVLDAIADMLSEEVDFTSLLVVSIGNPTDYAEDTSPTPGEGQRSADSTTTLPSNVCVTFRSNRFGPGSRYSYKRFSGILEPDVDGNNIDFASLTTAAAVATALGALISWGTGLYEPIQVRGGMVLGYSPVPADVHGRVDDWEVKTTIGSQNSRKPG